MMSDYLRFAMIMPFILYHFLEVKHLKMNVAITIQERIRASRINLVPKTIISCWIKISKTMKIVFNNAFTTEEYNILQQCLREEMILLSKVYNDNINLIF
jgi:hypothetical protein